MVYSTEGRGGGASIEQRPLLVAAADLELGKKALATGDSDAAGKNKPEAGWNARGLASTALLCLGFMRLALQTGTPIIPVATVGSEEQAPSLGNFSSMARLLGMPAFPLVLTPLPLPVRYHVEFGEPLVFEGSPDDEDHVIEEKVDVVKTRLREMIREGRERRTGIFS